MQVLGSETVDQHNGGQLIIPITCAKTVFINQDKGTGEFLIPLPFLCKQFTFFAQE